MGFRIKRTTRTGPCFIPLARRNAKGANSLTGRSLVCYGRRAMSAPRRRAVEGADHRAVEGADHRAVEGAHGRSEGAPQEVETS